MSHVGRLLVATPLIGDPNFERTVILLLAHGDEGAFGVVLNRPSDALVSEIVPEWAALAAPPDVMFLGGPVGRNAVVGLGAHTEIEPSDRWSPVIDGVGTVDLNQPPELWEELSVVRLFAGSAGWAPGQLDDELAEGAWWMIEPSADDVFSSDPVALWTRVLRRQSGTLAWFASHPGDPSVN
jgi:putative transcriptional regulator